MFEIPRGALYPVLPLRDIVVFPHMIVPLFVGREKSIAALEEALADAEHVLQTVDRPRRAVPPERPDATGLSPREREVLRLMVDGASNDEIATALNVSRRTAAQHVGSILGKLGASNRTAATMIAMRRGLV